MTYTWALSRRILLQAGAAAALAGPQGAAAGQAAPFGEQLAAFADEILRLSPEQATALGLDHGRYANLKSELADASPAGDAAWAAQVHDMRQRLTATNAAGLGEADRLRYDTVLYAAERGIEGTGFRYGGGAQAGFAGGAVPYVLSQQNGAVTSLPEFLNAEHQIATAADAEAYLARVSAFARVLDQESARVRADA